MRNCVAKVKLEINVIVALIKAGEIDLKHDEQTVSESTKMRLPYLNGKTSRETAHIVWFFCLVATIYSMHIGDAVCKIWF